MIFWPTVMHLDLDDQWWKWSTLRQLQVDLTGLHFCHKGRFVRHPAAMHDVLLKAQRMITVYMGPKLGLFP